VKKTTTKENKYGKRWDMRRGNTTLVCRQLIQNLK